MRRHAVLGWFGAVALLLVPCPAPACDLCGLTFNQPTLRQEMEDASFVLYGTIASSTIDSKGTGTAQFQVGKVLKNHPWLGNRTVLQLDRYVPVLDPKDPPKVVIFCNLKDGQFNPYRGTTVQSPALLTYLEGAAALRGKDRNTALLYFFSRVDDKDEDVSKDAFVELARSTNQEIGEVARHLPVQRLRSLVENPATPTSRLGLYAFLMAGNGGDREATALLDMIRQPTGRTVGALDGLLAGYIQLRPREGWDLTVSLLADRRRSLSQRFAIARALRFFHGWKPAETRGQVLRGLAALIDDGDMADQAVEDLRRWQMWDFTAKVLGLYGKQAYAAPITQRAILRYALSCPMPEARQLIEQVRRQEPDTISELEESLSFEKKR